MSDPVRQALKNGVGVVALESTILTHGLPKPINFQVEVLTCEVAFLRIIYIIEFSKRVRELIIG